VQRHQGDPLAGRLHLVGVRDQRDRFEEAGQPALGLAELVLLGDRLQLADVLDPALPLDGVVGLQLTHQPGEVPGLLHQHARAAALVHTGVQLVEHGDEIGDPAPLARAEPWDLAGAAQRLAERDLLLAGEALHRPLGGLADAAPRHVQHPPQADGVERVHNGLEVGQQVLDLAAVVELDAADDLVRQAGFDENLFQDTGLGVGPVEDHHLAVAVALLAEALDLLGHEGGLVVLVLGLVAGDRLPLPEGSPQVLGLALQVVGDH
jgi:hypothetical protein